MGASIEGGTYPTPSPVEVSAESVLKVVHRPRQRNGGRPKCQMEVVGHQGPRKNRESVPSLGLVKTIVEADRLTRIGEDLLTASETVVDVVQPLPSPLPHHAAHHRKVKKVSPGTINTSRKQHLNRLSKRCLHDRGTSRKPAGFQDPRRDVGWTRAVARPGPPDAALPPIQRASTCGAAVTGGTVSDRRFG